MEKYMIKDVEVEIYPLRDRPDMLYFVNFPEMNLNNDDVSVASEVFQKLCSHSPDSNFKMLNVNNEFKRIIPELLEKVTKDKKMNTKNQKLINILLRHTIGYGIIEPLLSDEDIQDVYIDSGSSTVHIVHSRFGECITNISMGVDDIEKLSTRLRAISKRPLDASMPVLHTELEDFGVRVCAVQPPSTYSGTGFAFRRRKSRPWTLPEFMDNKFMDHKTAGLLSFLIDGQSSVLITGPRSSGKTSLLTALLLEIPQNMRIILIEDTPEVPVDALRAMGHKIEHLKVEAFSRGFEMSAEDALRTTLRLGESVLVLGEVRSKEARSLFEAMRVGAAGNVVLGTIHGSSPYDTWDRVVNDLGVPSTSFKAVDIIVSLGAIRHGDDVKRHRRLMSITEVGKDWTTDPSKSFSDLVKYKRGSDSWTMNLSSSKTLKKIAEVKGMTPKQVRDNIFLRSKIKRELFKMSRKNPNAVGAKKVLEANNKYLKLSLKHKKSSTVFNEWKKWARK
jgi:type IV secretory pathway ATPase VirB11/archaellum biosynthesis ATPase